MKKCGCDSFPRSSQGAAVIIDSRISGGARRRRYRCKKCGKRWTTWETLTPPIDKIDIKQFQGPESSGARSLLKRQAQRKVSREVY